MDDKKQEENTGISTDITSDNSAVADSSVEAPAEMVESVETSEVNNVEEVANEDVAATEDSVKNMTPFNLKAYVIAIVVILLVSVGLMFVLEKEGRISTGLFSGIISNMEKTSPAAKVNGVVIPISDYKSSLNQLTEMAVQQGADVSDPAVTAQFKTQAIDTLVNAELLRQTALAEGLIASNEAIDARFNEIQDGIGGPEALQQRMNEFGVTEENLRKDIENEILIQGLFDEKVNVDSLVVTDSDVDAFYEKAGGAAAGLPPIAEVKDQIEAQIRFDQQQVLINAYVEEVRSEAEVEVLI